MFIRDFASRYATKISLSSLCLKSTPWVLAQLVCLLFFATGTLGYQACERNCAFGDVACVAAVKVCDTKIASYLIYMDQMGAGVTKYPLPDVYRDILRARYPQMNIAAHRFGYADRQPANNVTTDCNTTYYNSAEYVDVLRKSADNSNWFLLLHELVHPEQCEAAGGRERYAKRWWDELEAALIAQGTKVNFLQPPADLAKQIGALYSQVHNMMPMEAQASKKAGALLEPLRRCCISETGAPVRPLTLSGIEEQWDGGSSVRRILSVKPSNGDPPFTSRWWIQSPGDPYPLEQPQNLVRGMEFLWTPKNNPQNARVISTRFEQSRVWDHLIQVRVTQRSKNLDFLVAQRTISISERTFVDLPKSGPQFDKLPAELPPSKLPDLVPSAPEKPGPRPGPLPARPSAGP